jgi:hypothetical protein
MAFKDRDLLKPSIYALVAGLIVSVIGIIPIAVVAVSFGGSQIGNIVMGVMGAVMVFVQFVVTYVFSGMTAYLIFGYLSEGDGRMDHAWDVVRRDFFDILTLAAASTVVNLLKNAANRNRRGGDWPRVSSAARPTCSRSCGRRRRTSSCLPWSSMTSTSKDGMQRVMKITKENLLLIGISTVGVRWVTGLIGFVFGVGGFLLALAIGGGGHT